MRHAPYITPDDLLSPQKYGEIREEVRKRLLPIKRQRRLGIGPYTTLIFESYETMWHQIQEMLFIEKGGVEQIQDELEAYNPLIPSGDDLKATLMLEKDNPSERLTFLKQLTHIEQHVFIQCADEQVRALPLDNVERTREDGKTSAVHFFRFPIGEKEKSWFQEGEKMIMVGIDHPAYHHLAVFPEPLKQQLRYDLNIKEKT